MLGDHAAAFDRHRRVTMMVEVPQQTARRGGQRRRHVALGDRKLRQQVGAITLVQQRRPGFECGQRVDRRRQYLQIELHQLGRVFGDVAVFRHDHRHRFADMAHLVERQQRLARIDDLVLHAGAPFARQRQLLVTHRRQRALQLHPIHRQPDPGQGARAGEVDAADACVRVRAAHEHHMAHARQHHVGDELALADQQPRILAPRDWPPDKPCCFRVCHVLSCGWAKQRPCHTNRLTRY